VIEAPFSYSRSPLLRLVIVEVAVYAIGLLHGWLFGG
jgi:hypothetical protein